MPSNGQASTRPIVFISGRLDRLARESADGANHRIQPIAACRAKVLFEAEPGDEVRWRIENVLRLPVTVNPEQDRYQA